MERSGFALPFLPEAAPNSSSLGGSPANSSSSNVLQASQEVGSFMLQKEGDGLGAINPFTNKNQANIVLSSPLPQSGGGPAVSSDMSQGEGDGLPTYNLPHFSADSNLSSVTQQQQHQQEQLYHAQLQQEQEHQAQQQLQQQEQQQEVPMRHASLPSPHTTTPNQQVMLLQSDSQRSRSVSQSSGATMAAAAAAAAGIPQPNAVPQQSTAITPANLVPPPLPSASIPDNTDTNCSSSLYVKNLPPGAAAVACVYVCLHKCLHACTHDCACVCLNQRLPLFACLTTVSCDVHTYRGQ